MQRLKAEINTLRQRLKEPHGLLREAQDRERLRQHINSLEAQLTTSKEQVTQLHAKLREQENSAMRSLHRIASLEDEARRWRKAMAVLATSDSFIQFPK